MRVALVAAALPVFALGVYSTDPADSWNRIHTILFARTIAAFETSEYPEARASAPLPDPIAPFLALRVSGRTYDRDESGDRAVEALYPSFITSRGVDYVVAGPAYGALSQALDDAIAERRSRAAIDRALMQVDLWSAFDQLDAVAARPRVDAVRHDRAVALTRALATLIRKIALTPAEMAGLPDTMAAARSVPGFPDVFSPAAGWIEVQKSTHRMHDDAADMRRAARVFVRPRTPPADERAFLDALADRPGDRLAATALAIEAVLVDTHGRVVPTRLFIDVQVRTFVRDGRVLPQADVEEFELSRRRLREDATKAFVRYDGSAPAYLPIAGNDYGFATPSRDRHGETAPILSTLRSRCSACHGPDGRNFMTFDLIERPGAPLLSVVRLRPADDSRARAVVAAKEARADFAHLLALAGLR
jgi:hypothetical protein